MANRFTKSVLERQAKELKAHATEQAASAEPPAPAAEPAAIQETPAAAPPRQKAPAKQKAVASPPAPPVSSPQEMPAGYSQAAPMPLDLTAFIVRDEGRNAKNKTFYLDAAVIEGIRAAAAAQKVTDSKLVNDILKKILGV